MVRLGWGLLLLVGCSETVVGPDLVPDLSNRIAYTPAESAERVPVTTLPAEVLPGPGSVHDIGPMVDGRLVAWKVAPGQAVAAGDPLAELRSPELAGLESRAAELRSTVGQQTRIRDLKIAAARRGVASQAELREAEAGLVEATAALDAVRAQLRAVRDTTTRLGGGAWTWRSPVDGIVDTITCPLGTVSPEATCLSLVRPEGVVLQVSVPERHLARLSGPVTATFTAADGRTTTMAELGRAPAIDPHTRTRSFRFALSTGDLPLQGTSGRAALYVAPAGSPARIPRRALTRIDGAPTVFVRKGAEAKPQAVRIIGEDPEHFVIDGVAPGTEVAVRGVFLLKSLHLLEEG